MKINTVADLKKIINNLGDDFKLQFDIMTLIPEKQLKQMSYAYPYYKEDSAVEFHDVCYSEKVVCFGVYNLDDIDNTGDTGNKL